jgi:NADPH:quinone reductase-like Zn-dependent oxidoreductase
MQAVGLEAPDGELALIDVPVPRPGPEEVRVRVVTSSINPIDVRVATGRYPWGEYDYPVVPGFDFAGVVEERGRAVSRFAPGDEVLGYWNAARFHRGSWAEYVTVHADGYVARKPAGVTFEEAGALPLAAATALIMLEACASLDGETVLVVGAGGAIGGYAVQLAARAGGTVLATARPGDEARLRALGAAETIDYTREDIAAVARERYPGGLGVLIDLPNGRGEVARLSDVVRDGGRVASACWGADPKTLAQRGIVATNVAANACDPGVIARVIDLVASEKLAIGYDEVRPLEEVPKAVSEIAGGRSRKTVIRMAADPGG